MASALFGEDFLRRLEKLRLALVRSAGSRSEGLRLAGARGGTGEFREHRNYAAGDEPRYIDWNLYGRLERLFLKEFTPEHEGRAVVCLDCSASMGAGPGGPGKFDFARRLTAAVAYVGLAGGDRVTAVTFSGGDARPLALRGGAQGLYDLLEFLERARPAGESGLRPAAERAARAASGGGRGVAVWISDLWMPPAAWTDLAAATGRGADVVLARVLSPEEVAPPAPGALILVDSETGERLRLDGPTTSAGYEAAAAAHAGELAAFAARHRMRLVCAASDRPFEEAALELLARGRLVERT
ncbi:MAG TPA: DUF58 domain-containing protein [Planctomycetota bacterium]|nr:DUF58 domain-containing protein [Planctomycetota bacterium]